MERNEQVKLCMRQIYRQASLVVAWLGPAADDSDNAMEVMDVVGREAVPAGVLALRVEDLQGVLDPLEDPKWAQMKKTLDGIAEKVGQNIPYSAIRHLSLRSYWRRIWIIQEVSLAEETTLFCGSRRLPFSHFAATLYFIIFYGYLSKAEDMIMFGSINVEDLADPVKAPAVLAKIQTLQERQAKVVEIPDQTPGILFHTRQRCQSASGWLPETLVEIMWREFVGTKIPAKNKVTDLKDLVYGQLGLASDTELLGIVPEYSVSTTVERVYSDTTRRLIQRGYLDVLTWCQQPRSLKDLPSWTPELSSRIHDPCGVSRRRRLFSASGTQSQHPPAPAHDQPANILHLTCNSICTTKTLAPHTWNTDYDADFDFVSAIEYLTTITTYCVSTGLDSLQDKVWRISIGDVEDWVNPVRATAFSHTGYNDLRAWIDHQHQPASQPHPRTPACESYMLAMGRMYRRKPFCSDQLVGLVPGHAEEGDVVALVQGADVPFVFRRLSDRHQGQEQCWQLIGEAYVHGFMDGEVVERGVGVEWEVFEVC